MLPAFVSAARSLGSTSERKISAKDICLRFKEAGVDELILVMQCGTVPHELVMESIKTFGEQVLPHFG